MKKRYVIIPLILILVAGGVILLRSRGDKKTSTTSASKGSYVALGDSIAAGTGLETASDPSACERTDEAYSHAVATSLNLKLESVACTGATITTGLIGPQLVNQASLPPQIDQLYAQDTKPKLITLTIGANDIGWSTVITRCYTGVCGTPEDTAEIASRIGAVGIQLDQILKSLQQHYGGVPPNVIVTGYFQAFAVGARSCSEATDPISSVEADWWRTQATSLNAVISADTQNYAFAKFAALDFSGHELCTSDPWVQDITGSAPFHPTADGQASIARSVLAANTATKP